MYTKNRLLVTIFALVTLSSCVAFEGCYTEESPGNRGDITRHIRMKTELERKAHLGDAESMFIVGLSLQNDDNQKMGENYQTALTWYRQSAEKNYPPAMVTLANALREEYNSDNKHTGEICKWYSRAAELNNSEAMLVMSDGNCPSTVSPMTWLKKSAERGNVNAMGLLATAYAEGNRVEQDYAKALSLFLRARERSRMANVNFEMYDYRDKALKSLEPAAKSGDADAMFAMGYLLSREDSGERKTRWLLKAAKAGHTLAMIEVGNEYERHTDWGTGLPVSIVGEPEEALEWYQRAADKGDATGMYLLGRHYEEGKGVKQDTKQAISWYRKAAKQHNTRAMNALGRLYWQGQLIKQDTPKAFKWYHQSADWGNANAMVELSHLYCQRIPAQNSIKAGYWFHQSVENGAGN